MKNEFKSDSDIWLSHHDAWNYYGTADINTSLDRAYTAADQAAAAISSFGLGGITSISLNFSRSNIDDLEEKRKRLVKFCGNIHDDVDALIDSEFSYGVMEALKDVYALNPSDITLSSLAPDNNLTSMMSVIIIDPALRKGFLETAKDLGEDAFTDDLKYAFIDAVGRHYINQGMADKMDSKAIYDKKFEADKNLVIEYYEYLNPEDAKNLDNLFAKMYKNGNYDKDIQNIKYIAYTAEEPYRSIFFKYLPDMDIKNFDVNGTQYYEAYQNDLYLDFNNGNNGKDDPRGPYVTFFHECGHAIDDLAVKDGLFNLKDYSTSYESAGMSFHDVIKLDVRNFLMEVTEKYVRNCNFYKGASEAEIKSAIGQVVNVMMQAGNNYSGLSSDLQIIYSNVQNAVGCCVIKIDYSNTTSKKTYYKYEYNIGKNYNFFSSANEAFGDMLSGMTDNTVSGGYGHRKDIKDVTDTDYNNQYASGYYYWFNKDGVATGSQENEAFAELFSYGMTGSSAQQGVVDEYLPEAEEYFKGMIRGLSSE